MPVQAHLILAMMAGLDETTGMPVLAGVGWTVRPPEPQPMAIQALIYVPRDEKGRHTWRLEMTYADGTPVKPRKSAEGVPTNFIFENEDDVTGIDASNLTTPLTTGPLIVLPPFPLPRGREYVWRLWVDGETKDSWTAPFRTTPPLPQPDSNPTLQGL
jgi:hypothetical protein